MISSILNQVRDFLFYLIKNDLLYFLDRDRAYPICKLKFINPD